VVSVPRQRNEWSVQGFHPALSNDIAGLRFGLVNTSRMSEVINKEAVSTPNSNISIDENEVKEIIESIKEAQYFDPRSMAALTPASVVSIRGISYKNRSEEGTRQL
jgi:hypothetical protein